MAQTDPEVVNIVRINGLNKMEVNYLSKIFAKIE